MTGQEWAKVPFRASPLVCCLIWIESFLGIGSDAKRSMDPTQAPPNSESAGAAGINLAARIQMSLKGVCAGGLH